MTLYHATFALKFNLKHHLCDAITKYPVVNCVQYFLGL